MFYSCDLEEAVIIVVAVVEVVVEVVVISSMKINLHHSMIDHKTQNLSIRGQ